MGDEVRIVLDALPTVALRAAATYLGDILRECQLVVVGHDADGGAGDPALAEVAASLIPDLEEVGDAFQAADVVLHPDGSTALRTTLRRDQDATVARLQVQLLRLRELGRGGGLLVESDPRAVQLLAWIWDEVAEQLQGRAPRPYVAAA